MSDKHKKYYGIGYLNSLYLLSSLYSLKISQFMAAKCVMLLV